MGWLGTAHGTGRCVTAAHTYTVRLCRVVHAPKHSCYLLHVVVHRTSQHSLFRGVQPVRYSRDAAMPGVWWYTAPTSSPYARTPPRDTRHPGPTTRRTRCLPGMRSCAHEPLS
jgi:hypothetical protein